MAYLNIRVPGSNSRHEIGNIADPYAPLSASIAFEGDTNILRFYGGGYLSVDMSAGASGNAVFGGQGRLSVYDEGVTNRFVGGDTDNYAYLRGTGANVNFGDGSNGLTDYGVKTSFRLGDGDNNLWLNGQKGVGTVGEGDNVVTLVEESLDYKLTLGGGNNELDLNGKGSKVTVGGGDNTFTFGDESKGNTIVAGGGDNNFNLRGMSHIVTTGDGRIYANVESANTKLTLGNGNYDVFSSGKNFSLTAGTGQGYVYLNAPGAKVNLGGIASIIGSASSDTIVANGNGKFDGPQTYINAGAGSDTVVAGDYSEVLLGSGSDTAMVGKNATVKGGAGGDTIDAGVGSTIDGGADPDRISFVGGQVMGGADGDTFIPKAASGYTWTDFNFNAKGLVHDTLDLSKLVAAMDVNTLMGVGVYGSMLELQITSGGKLVNVSLGNVGDDVTKAGGFYKAAGIGMINGAPDVIKPLVYDERG